MVISLNTSKYFYNLKQMNQHKTMNNIKVIYIRYLLCNYFNISAKTIFIFLPNIFIMARYNFRGENMINNMNIIV